MGMTAKKATAAKKLGYEPTNYKTKNGRRFFKT
jgi:hypothetical protein